MKVALSGIYYPMAILRYFESALKRRGTMELYTVGPYTENWIPWKGGMTLPAKYAKPPDQPLSRSYAGQSIPSAVCDCKDADLFISCDAGWSFLDRPPGKVTALIQTDPHVLNYDRQRKVHDYSFCMQEVYSKPGDIYLPYAFDPTVHYPMDLEKEYDVCLIGLQYNNRTSLVSALRAKGYKVLYTIGLAFDEYREAYNKSKVAISWSSRQDLIARVFEVMGMRIPLVCNRVPDLKLHFEEEAHYLGFSTVQEGVDHVERILKNYVAYGVMADLAYEEVMEKHTYDHRVGYMLETVGLL